MQSGREVIVINIGQAGVQLGSSIWSQHNEDHFIDSNGFPRKKSKNEKNYSSLSRQVFYDETIHGKFIPRTIFMDLDPMTIEELSSQTSLFHPQSLIKGNPKSKKTPSQKQKKKKSQIHPPHN